MKKKGFIILSLGLVLTIALVGGFNSLRMRLIADQFTVERGSSLDQEAGTYAKGNIQGAVLDVSKVDINALGNYTACITKGSQTLNFTVAVVDTIAPKASAIQGLKFRTNEAVAASSLVTDIEDKSQVEICYQDGAKEKTYTAGGNYSEGILLYDEGGNKTSVEAGFDIIADSTSPVLTGVKKITVYEGDRIDYLTGISATDDRDGDITDRIIVNSDMVAQNTPGTYKVSYEITDQSGNSTTKTAKVIVKKDNAPVIKGAKDKIIVINGSINYLSGVKAIDDKDGNITDKISVNSSKVSLKQSGSYQVVYTVQDSYGNKAKKTITVTVKNKASAAQSSSTNKTDSNTKKSTTKNTKKSKSSSGFTFFDVEPEGKDVNGDIDAGGKQDVGTWN